MTSGSSGEVTTATNQLIEAELGDTVFWSIEYGETSLDGEITATAPRMSLQFTFANSQAVRLDSLNRSIGQFRGGLINWGLSESDELSFIDFPEGSTRTVMTMRIRGADLIEGNTFGDLRNPSFDQLDDFFGFVENGRGPSIFFEVDISSIEIFEVLPGEQLDISIQEAREINLRWPVLSEDLYRIEASTDLLTFFNVHEQSESEAAGAFTEEASSDSARFYRLSRLHKISPIFVFPPPEESPR